MAVEIGELVSNVHVMDGDPQTMDKLKQLMLKVIEEHENHQKQVRAEQHVSSGVSQELQEDLD